VIKKSEPTIPTTDLSVVFPCLNEVQAVRRCVEDACKMISELGFTGEIIVCDNGSTDDSSTVAEESGAIVVRESLRGYGSACRAGLGAAKGRILVLMDCDGTYRSADIRGLIAPIQKNLADVVLGSRFLGGMQPGSMPRLNRWVGNPVLTTAVRHVSGVSTTDGQSGMRAISKTVYTQLSLHSTGPEFAHEFLIEIGRRRVRVTELSVHYLPRIGKTKLRRWRAACRHAGFLLSVVCGGRSS
jgi:glycosyltransferase involved in cell wall biosynthesis